MPGPEDVDVRAAHVFHAPYGLRIEITLGGMGLGSAEWREAFEAAMGPGIAFEMPTAAGLLVAAVEDDVEAEAFGERVNTALHAANATATSEGRVRMAERAQVALRSALGLPETGS